MGFFQDCLRNAYYIFTIIAGLLHWHYSKRFTKRKPNAKLEKLEEIEKVSDRVTRVLAQNPGPFTLQGTNTYLVGKGPKKFLIDTGEPDKPEYINILRKALDVNEIIGIICTHWHRDHIGGLKDVVDNVCGPDVPVYKLNRTDGKPEPSGFTIVEDGKEFMIDDETTLKVIATRGHTSDHMAVWLPEEKILFSGDCVLGFGSSIFEDLSSYMESLEIIQKLNSEVICPGHGPLIQDPSSKMDEYVHHRVKREKQIVDFLNTTEKANALEVTQALYKKLPKSVQIGAFGNIQQHLKKLVKEGKATRSGYFDYVLVQ